MTRKCAPHRGVGFALLTAIGLVPFVVAALSLADSTIPPEDPDAPPPRDVLFALHGIDAGLPTDDLRAFIPLLNGVRVVGLGEEAHGSAAFPRFKGRMVRYLVEKHGFRNLAMEVPWLAAEAAEQYVESCEGDESAALRSLDYPQFRDRSVGELLTWMCRFNRAHPNDRVRFFGVDEEEPFRYGALFGEYLRRRFGESRAQRISRDIGRCAGARDTRKQFWKTYLGITTGEAPVTAANFQGCLDGIDSVVSLVASDRASPSAELERLLLAAIGMKAFETQMFNWRKDGYQQRDLGMAKMLLHRIAGARGKTIYWAADLHVAAAPIADYHPAGEWLHKTLGAEYLAIGMGAYRLRQWPESRVPEIPAEPDSLDSIMHEYGKPYLLMDLTLIKHLHEFSLRGLKPLRPRDHFQAFVFVDESAPVEVNALDEDQDPGY